MKKKIFTILMLAAVMFFNNNATGQNKKKQIEILTFQIDSLKNVLSNERIVNDKLKDEQSRKIIEKTKTIDELKNNLNSKNLKIQTCNEEQTKLLKEIKLKNAFIFSVIDEYSPKPTISNYQKIVIASHTVTIFPGYVPPGEEPTWGGDHYDETTYQYFLLTADNYEPITDIGLFFNDKKADLLKRINKTAKDYFIERKEAMRGGSEGCDNFEDSFYNLDFGGLNMYITGDSFHFVWISYSSGFCGDGTNSVEFPFTEIDKYLK